MTPSLRFKTRHGVALTGFALLSGWTQALAQPPGLVTDRPDQTESAAVVPDGSYQIETGVSFTRSDSRQAELESVQILGTLVRLGISERAELRIGFDGFVSTSLESRRGQLRRRSEGLGDASIGTKFLIASERSGRPQIALLAATTVPIGDDDVTSDDFDPSVRLAMSTALSDRIGLGWNVGIDTSGNRETAFYTVSSAISLDERSGVFVELFGDDDGAHSFDTGWTRLLAPNSQIDFAVGAGLTDEAPDWSLGVGFSLRLPE